MTDKKIDGQTDHSVFTFVAKASITFIVVA